MSATQHIKSITRILSAIWFCVPFLAFAQDEIMLSSGQLIKGIVQSLGPAYATLLPIGSDKSERLYADQINYVRRRNASESIQYFYSKKVFSVNSTDGLSIPRLLLLRSGGKIKTYSYTILHSRSDVNRYYLEKDDSGIIFIGDKSGLTAIRNDAMTAREVTKQVSLLFEDNTELRSRYDADKKQHKRKVIMRYVKEYNNWSEHLH